MSGDGQNSSRSALLTIQVGVYLFVVSAVAVALWWLRSNTIPAYQQHVDREQLLSRGDHARGSQPVASYHEGEWVRVRDFAPARTRSGSWVGIEEDSVLVVTNPPTHDLPGGWLLASGLGRPAAHPLMMHASFVERYNPAVLAGGLELSGCRIRRYVKTGGLYYSVTGELRNGTDRVISRCEVICQLRDSAGEPLAELRSTPMALDAGRFGEFETMQAGGDLPVTSIALQVRYRKAGQAEESSQVLVSLRAPREAPRGQSPN
jgi:hypothetical protein